MRHSYDNIRLTWKKKLIGDEEEKIGISEIIVARIQPYLLKKKLVSLFINTFNSLFYSSVKIIFMVEQVKKTIKID